MAPFRIKKLFPNDDVGQVVGSWGTNPAHAFLYSNGMITSLHASGFTGCAACAISTSAGQGGRPPGQGRVEQSGCGGAGRGDRGESWSLREECPQPGRDQARDLTAGQVPSACGRRSGRPGMKILRDPAEPDGRQIRVRTG